MKYTTPMYYYFDTLLLSINEHQTAICNRKAKIIIPYIFILVLNS